jgi:hypothetical protein
MKVNSYTLANVHRDGTPPPRVWRISTDDGVLWLAEDGGRSRLIRLPLPINDADKVAYLEEVGQSPCEALALTAETEAASRWVRKVSMVSRQPAVSGSP